MQVYKSHYAPPVIPTDISYPQLLLRHNPDDVEPEKVIFEDFEGPFKSITYGGIRTSAALGAAGLRAVLGVQEGDVVAVLGTNSVDYAILGNAIMWAGATMCAVNPIATAHELVHYLAVATAKVIFAEADGIARVEKALEMSPGLKVKPIVALLGHSTPETARYTTFPRDVLDEKRTPLPPFDLSNRDSRNVPAVICFSSGTSGKPKGVFLSHYNVVAYQLCMRCTEPFLYNAFQREIFYAPFSHIYGIIAAMTLAPFYGHYVVLMRRYQFEKYIERCSKIRATVLRLIPATAVSMVKDPFVRGLDLKSVDTVMCAGAPLQAHVVQQMKEMMGRTDIVQGYGLSETSVTFLRGYWSVKKAGSVGLLSTGVSARIVDDDHNDVPHGEQGEILVQSPYTFMGYKDNPEETASSFKDGWFLTGDVGRMDDDGFMWLTDRKKELIKYKGNQVPPAELEDVLLSHPNVKEAAVCGVWDEVQQTELPMGYISLREKASSATEVQKQLQEVKEFVDSRVSPHKKLRGGLHYLEEFPKNHNGKLVRRLLPAKVEEDKKAAQKAQRAKL
ncbi:hypothetical protein AJ80_07527 [Polytolypa hystricis UAMH7299]|uniref:AMP-dependent synthetase/ligase domain-containing protein n=1 Tax=Polytolypa hystricis (strain UAMH7299) TaxID=1447883 RepID=A0A2B7XFN0_POLH7|nr:hypothetical protein AJ80_07527 [Polytolypa hystricis UAMH7299]